MIITETRYRSCCEPQDLKYFSGPKVVGVSKGSFVFANEGEPAISYCQYCGQLWREERYMDAAGDTDWEWMKVNARIGVKQWR